MKKKMATVIVILTMALSTAAAYGAEINPLDCQEVAPRFGLGDVVRE